MSRRRRIFDLDLPEEEAPDAASAGAASAPAAPAPAAGSRPGPMAAAISETGAALRGRQEVLAAIRAENDALAHEYVEQRRLGLVVRRLPLEAIGTRALIRDRRAGREGDEAMDELVASLRAIGLSNPIRVRQEADGGYELVQGWRRLSAYRRLHAADPGAPDWATIPALVVPEGESLETLYQRMVDENLVRQDISFYEMAALARAYAAEVEGIDAAGAVSRLFASAGYQKRSYIRAFLALVEALDAHLAFPEAIPRNLGLDLVRALEARPALREELIAALAAQPDRDAEAEIAALRRAARPPQAAPKTAPVIGPEASPDGAQGTTQDLAQDEAQGPAQGAAQGAAQGGAGRARASPARLDVAAGGLAAEARLQGGRIEIALSFGTDRVPSARLEAALKAFLQSLS